MATKIGIAGEVDLSLGAPVKFDATDRATSAAGAAATVTIAADSEVGIVLSQIHAGYSAAPAAGSTLKVEDGAGTTVWNIPVGAGPYEFNFVPPRVGTKNTALVVTLSAGGGAVVADLNVNAYRIK